MARQQTESGGFGAILSFHLEQLRAESGEAGLRTLTQVIADVGNKTGISAAHIMRMKGRAGFPSNATLEKLAAQLPALGKYLSEITPQSGSWARVEEHQSRLPRGSTITVVTGTVPHLADKEIDPEVTRRMALRVAQNVIEKESSYLFVFPSGADHQALRRQVIRRAYAQWVDQHADIDDAEHARQQLVIETGIHATTVSDPDNTFWPLMPRYGVFHNLSRTATTLPQFGMFWIRGVSPFVTTKRAINVATTYDPRSRWEGWVLLDAEDFNDLAPLIVDRVGNAFIPPPQIDIDSQPRK